jgi:hypothetical protein
MLSITCECSVRFHKPIYDYIIDFDYDLFIASHLHRDVYTP